MNKERSLILRDWEARAIIEGRKTMLRRVLSLPKSVSRHAVFHHVDQFGTAVFTDGTWVRSPFGQPGDRLIGKEAWRRNTFDTPDGITYQAGTATGLALARWFDGTESTEARERIAALPRDGKWRSAIRMPRWASRILLEIVAVRVERLQDINEADARAEGIPWSDGSPDEHGLPTRLVVAARDEYRHKWEADHGPGSWGANPWVWAVEFRRVSA